ncbi:biotin carboxylase [Bacillus canaveralius]|uniref:biotin carboxylase n=1 Tax=Bacillus canaveralius TaxID=1403243 RepID=A0A2N5GNM8_9BACI|nr:biotin carboxylase N-terminal domain-containing protein [Bacillus canaveralius]PLR84105.1 biotin carboxylase [Bacillus canaveralius]PLR96249.1 biotin carboxylase [Bacillus canaveralius]
MRKVLIANRGEIASRIIRTCHQMGIETVAVFSDADQDMPYVREAKSAFRIGEPPVNKSYLKGNEILEIARAEGVEGIHPGYGFLSENPDFARAVRTAGMIFIGPEAETIELMGDKIASRQTMKDAGVPVVPGSEEGMATLEAATAFAASIGYPVMLKASGGGGGIGMVRCENEQALTKFYESTKARAKAYFGSEEVFIEKYIDNARHVEVQIFGDVHGNIVHLYERDCSIQRRHQKVIEEAPCPFLSQQVREELYKTAIKAAAAVKYVNAGTIEFIVDEQQNFYFLEMNTRLQVEHPITEQITGLDLVKWQILTARGEQLPLLQPDILQAGHAIEFRLYAEDPVTFMPSPGKIATFTWEESPGVRIDHGYEEGNTVTPFYDPMISKCIFYGETRMDAIHNAGQFFNSLSVAGIKTNLPLFKEIVNDSDFRNGSYSTGYLSSKSFAVK